MINTLLETQYQSWKITLPIVLAALFLGSQYSAYLDHQQAALDLNGSLATVPRIRDCKLVVYFGMLILLNTNLRLHYIFIFMVLSWEGNILLTTF